MTGADAGFPNKETLKLSTQKTIKKYLKRIPNPTTLNCVQIWQEFTAALKLLLRHEFFTFSKNDKKKSCYIVC